MVAILRIIGYVLLSAAFCGGLVLLDATYGRGPGLTLLASGGLGSALFLGMAEILEHLRALRAVIAPLPEKSATVEGPDPLPLSTQVRLAEEQRAAALPDAGAPTGQKDA